MYHTTQLVGYLIVDTLSNMKAMLRRNKILQNTSQSLLHCSSQVSLCLKRIWENEVQSTRRVKKHIKAEMFAAGKACKATF